jgi:hypothetical protein
MSHLQGDLGEKMVNILGGDSTDHYGGEKNSCDRVSNSER